MFISTGDIVDGVRNLFRIFESSLHDSGFLKN